MPKVFIITLWLDFFRELERIEEKEGKLRDSNWRLGIPSTGILKLVGNTSRHEINSLKMDELHHLLNIMGTSPILD